MPRQDQSLSPQEKFDDEKTSNIFKSMDDVLDDESIEIPELPPVKLDTFSNPEQIGGFSGPIDSDTFTGGSEQPKLEIGLDVSDTSDKELLTMILLELTDLTQIVRQAMGG